jgi:hypothetical protein
MDNEICVTDVENAELLEEKEGEVGGTSSRCRI